MNEFSIAATNWPAPCLGCKDRYLGCHSKCEKYAKQKQIAEDAKKNREKWKERWRFK